MIVFYSLWLVSALFFQIILFKLKSIEIMISTEGDPKKVITAYKNHKKMSRCSMCLVFLTGFVIITGGGSLMLMGVYDLPDWLFFVMAAIITIYAVSVLLLTARMLCFFYSMGMNLLNILAFDMRVATRRLQFGFVALGVYAFVDQTRMSGFLAFLVISTVTHLEAMKAEKWDLDCNRELHWVMYILYWWQVAQPLIYSSVVCGIVHILAKAQEHDMVQVEKLTQYSGNIDNEMPFDSSITDLSARSSLADLKRPHTDKIRRVSLKTAPDDNRLLDIGNS